MTRQRSFKHLVRARMTKTGESYTAARAMLLSAHTPHDADPPALATSDEAIRERTGRGWEEWFDLLDDWGAPQRSHREIARWVAGLLGIEPLGWSAQAVTTSYERARRGRAVGQHADGFSISTSKTVPVGVEQLFDAVEDAQARAAWLNGIRLTERTSTRPRSARFDCDDGQSRVNLTFDARADGRSRLTVEHARLDDADAAARMKVWWRERLMALESTLKGGGTAAQSAPPDSQPGGQVMDRPPST